MLATANITKQITIVTPDNSILRWAPFAPGDKKTVTVFSTKNLKGKNTTYHLGTTDLDIKKLVRTFMPGFTHMLDGSVIRLISTRFYKRCRYVPQTIHDALLMNPFYFFIFYEEIIKIYLENGEDSLFNLIEKCFILPSLNEIPKDKQDTLEPLVMDFFQKQGTLVESDLCMGKMLRMYSPEC